MNNFRHKIHQIIFEADTPAGKIFDLSLLILILLSVLVVMLESVDSLRNQYQPHFDLEEWTFMVFFPFIIFQFLFFYILKQKNYLRCLQKAN